MSHTQGLLYGANTGWLFFSSFIAIQLTYMSIILTFYSGTVGGGELSHTEKLLHVTVLETPYTH